MRENKPSNVAYSALVQTFGMQFVGEGIPAELVIPYVLRVSAVGKARGRCCGEVACCALATSPTCPQNRELTEPELRILEGPSALCGGWDPLTLSSRFEQKGEVKLSYVCLCRNFFCFLCCGTLCLCLYRVCLECVDVS